MIAAKKQPLVKMYIDIKHDASLLPICTVHTEETYYLSELSDICFYNFKELNFY